MAILTNRRPTFGRAALVVFACLFSLSTGCGRASTADLIAASRSNDSSDRARAVQALGERTKDAGVVVPVLVERLKDEDAFVRRDAARALGKIGPGAATAAPALRHAMRDANAHVRLAASEAVRKIDPDAARASSQ